MVDKNKTVDFLSKPTKERAFAEPLFQYLAHKHILRILFFMTKLDEIALSVELVLISLIESVALTFLAEHSIPALQEPDAWKYIPYVLGGLAIILVFWAQSILHAISFIRWPIRVGHMFLYFITAFVQILAYSALENLTMWFAWWCVFTALGFAMYIADLGIIREMHGRSMKTVWGSFMVGVEKRHLYEMRVLIPAAFVFNIAALCVVTAAPQLFTSPISYAIPGILQLLVSVGAIYDCVRNFQLRSDMIAETVEHH